MFMDITHLNHPRRRRSWYQPKLLQESEYKEIERKYRNTIINALTESLDQTEHLIDIHIIQIIADFSIGIIINCCNNKYGCNNKIMFDSLQELDSNAKQNHDATPHRYVPYWRRYWRRYGNISDDENEDEAHEKIPIYQYIAKADMTNTVSVNDTNRRIFCEQCTKSSHKVLSECNFYNCRKKDVERFCCNHEEVSTCNHCHERYVSSMRYGNRCDCCYEYLSSWICRGCVRAAADNKNHTNWDYLLSINWKKQNKKNKNKHCEKCNEYICSLCHLCNCNTSYDPKYYEELMEDEYSYMSLLPPSLCLKLRIWNMNTGCHCCSSSVVYEICRDYGYDDDRFKQYKRAKNYRKWPVNALEQNKWNLKGIHMKGQKLQNHLQRIEDKKKCNLRKKEKYNNRSCVFNHC